MVWGKLWEKLLGGPVLSGSSQWNITLINTIVSNVIWQPVQPCALCSSIFSLRNFGWAFFSSFLWEIGINHSVPLNFSVLKCRSLWKFVCISYGLFWLLVSSFTLHVVFQSLWIFFFLPDNTERLECDLGQCMCQCLSSASLWYQMYIPPSPVAVHLIPSFLFLKLSNCTLDKDLNFHPLCKPEVDTELLEPSPPKSWGRLSGNLFKLQLGRLGNEKLHCSNCIQSSTWVESGKREAGWLMPRLRSSTPL